MEKGYKANRPKWQEINARYERAMEESKAIQEKKRAIVNKWRIDNGLEPLLYEPINRKCTTLSLKEYQQLLKKVEDKHYE